MRVVVDLQACQTASRMRGIGRYSLALVQALIALAKDDEVLLALNAAFPDAVEWLRERFADTLPAGRIRVWTGPTPVAEDEPLNMWRTRTSEAIREAFLRSLRPDVVLVTSLFEGFVDDATTSVPSETRIPHAVMLYDLIPLVRSSVLTTPEARGWYERKLESLRRADLLLAISNHARDEAIAAAHLPRERIAVISTAADPCFRSIELTHASRDAFFSRLGIRAPFVLYAGGYDERKNVVRLIRAYADLAPELRNRHSLVLAGAIGEMERRELLREATRARVPATDLAFTGHIDDEDLAALYTTCAAFVFPSLHEGFGLPVLEAMSCGAPVIAANATSIPEVIERGDALFDPHEPASIAGRLTTVLTDSAFRDDLRRYGIERARAFSWPITAQRALDAVHALVERHRKSASLLAGGATDRNAGASSRPKLAFVSPLPPERTGVAFYAYELLAALAAHYRIEVVADQKSATLPAGLDALPLRTFEWFDANADGFDRVLYQMGNSPFHHRMFDLIAHHPGTVVMHDLYLGAVLNWMEHVAVAPGIFSRWLFQSHGYPALVVERDAGRAAAIDAFPCSWPVIDSACGVVVHSAHACDLAQRWFHTDRDDWRQVPQLRRLPPGGDRAAARSSLGIGEDHLLFCSFGFVDAAKLDHRILDAWCKSPLAADKRCSLVFVGENQGGDYGRELLDRVSSLPRVRITGYADTATFEAYLLAADAAIQLRGVTRGETSRTVLDCLAHGVPVIVNASGSLRELPAHVLLRLPAEFGDDDLIGAMTRVATDAALRGRLSGDARRYVAEAHDPDRVAAKLRDAIEHFAREASYAGYAKLIDDVARNGVGTRNGADMRAVAQCIAVDLRRAPARQILVDVSILERQDLRTGIERVVRAVLAELLRRTPDGWRVEPVVADRDCYRYARRFTGAWLGIPGEFGDDAPIEVAQNDVFLGLDWAANIIPDQEPVLARYRALGVNVTFLVHDLLPVLHPEFYPAGIDTMHAAWLDTLARVADGLLCVSHSVADALVAWLDEHALDRISRLAIGVLPLGADIERSVPSKGMPDDAPRVCAELARRVTVLMVGTVEPRKAHAQALEAFELLWSRGFDANLVIVGKQGWMVDELATRLRAHPELGRRLFWFENASDEWLDALYDAADVLLAPSRGEGYGLPLVEAARHGIPVVARDLPVFREVAGDAAAYFAGDSPDAIADAITDWKHVVDAGHASPATIEWRTWRDTVDALLAMIVEGRWLRFWQPNSSSVADPGVRRLRITRRIDFSQMRLSPAIAGVKGLSGRESWGRWSDADVHPHVEIRFRDPLPVSGTLALTARAFGPNVGQPIRVRIGRYETQLHFDAQDTTAMASYALHEAPRLLEIVPPHPMQPRELGASSDPRRLGIGLVRLTIRAA